jgi:hypothetical protein
MNVPSSILTSAVNQFNQSPPPTLREILTAYKERGDGDKAMLMALLQAKTAEDERIASMASLHRTVLDAYYRYPAPGPSSYREQPSYSPHPHSYSSIAHAPPSPPHSYSSYSYARKRSRYTDSPSHSRSRSRSPVPRRDGTQSRCYSSKYSPRTQASMAIDSLLSSSSESTASVGTTRGDLDCCEEEDAELDQRRGRSIATAASAVAANAHKGGDCHVERNTAAVPVR